MSEAAVPSSSDPVLIDRVLFGRIELQRSRVAETEVILTRKNAEFKAAKADHESAHETLEALVGEMVRMVNGEPSRTPLFDHMNDAIDHAAANPITQKLLRRLLDRHYSNLNALIIDGYTEDERREIVSYLDALDARDAAVETNADSVPDILPEPAVLRADVDAQMAVLKEKFNIPTDDQIAAALLDQSIAMHPAFFHLSPDQRRAVLTWAAACASVRAEKGEALVFDDLPAAPTFILNPSEISVPAPQDKPVDTAKKTPKPKKPRAPRRSSKEFSNKPRMATAKKKGK